MESLGLRSDIAIYLLASLTSQYIHREFIRRMPNDAASVEFIARDLLFGLQFAIAGIRGELPKGRFVEDLVDSHITERHGELAVSIIHSMRDYSLLRDCFISYMWSGFEQEIVKDNVLRFVDPPDWPGIRDRSQQVISQEVKQQQILEYRDALMVPLNSMLKQIVDIPPGLRFNGLKVEDFVNAWNTCFTTFSSRWHNAQSLVMEKNDVVLSITGSTGMSRRDAEQFVSLITFDRQYHALSLFHCPLIPLSDSSLFVFTPGFLFANPLTCIPRLAVHRGSGISAYSNILEAHLLDRLKNHFSRQGVSIRTRVSYSSRNDKGDIDLVVYDSSNDSLLIGMVKAFIHPDTVEEVTRANEALYKGIGQIQRVKDWLKGFQAESWGNRLQIPVLKSPRNTTFAVIGNGFAGSDYLPIPEDVTMVDAKYLLLRKFAGKSVFSAINDYTQRLLQESKVASERLRHSLISVGGWDIYIPHRN